MINCISLRKKEWEKCPDVQKIGHISSLDQNPLFTSEKFYLKGFERCKRAGSEKLHFVAVTIEHNWTVFPNEFELMSPIIIRYCNYIFNHTTLRKEWVL